MTYLAWGYIPTVVIEIAGAALIAYVTGYAAFLAAAFVHGFTTELRRQRKG